LNVHESNKCEASHLRAAGINASFGNAKARAGQSPSRVSTRLAVVIANARADQDGEPEKVAPSLTMPARRGTSP